VHKKTIVLIPATDMVQTTRTENSKALSTYLLSQTQLAKYYFNTNVQESDMGQMLTTRPNPN